MAPSLPLLRRRGPIPRMTSLGLLLCAQVLLLLAISPGQSIGRDAPVPISPMQEAFAAIAQRANSEADTSSAVNVNAIINNTLVPRNNTRTVRIGYMASRSFFGKFVIGGLLAELIFRASHEFWDAHNDNVVVELVYGEAATTPQETAQERCSRVAEDLAAAGVHAVIGPPSSACSQPSAAVFGRTGIPQISHSATSQALSNKTTFPSFFRIPPSDAKQADVLASIASMCGWSSVGIIATTDAWGQGLVNTLAPALSSHNISVGQRLLLQQGLPLENITELFREYKRDIVSSVNFLIALREDGINFVKAAIAVGMTGPGWNWLAADGIATNTGVTPDLLESMGGMVGVQPLSVSGPLSDAFHSFPDSLKYSQYVQDTSIPSFSSRLFDAVAGVRIAVNTADVWNGTDQNKQRIVRERLREFNSTANAYPGASSAAIFFDETQDGPSFYEVVNVVEAKYQTVAVVAAGQFETTDTQVQWADEDHTGFSSCPSQTPQKEPKSSSGGENTSLIIVVAVLSVGVVAASILAVVLDKRNRQKKRPHDFSEDLRETGLGTPDILLPPPELRRTSIKLGEKLGAGYYGQVFKGTLDESASAGLPQRAVAVKTCHDEATSADIRSLLKEAAYMAQFKGHVNVVALVGVVTRGRPVYLVMEYCENGSLDRYLRTAFKRVQLSVVSKIRMGIDIVEGMCFISGKGAIHRDLACRNVLVTKDFTCKITDFGLTRNNTYYMSNANTVPIKWTAPEALTDGCFSVASDVWSFGITLCEIFLNGATPYPGLSNEAVRVGLCCGDLRHPRVPGMPDKLYELLLKCWTEESPARPSFTQLREELIYLVDQEPEASMMRLQQLNFSSETASLSSKALSKEGTQAPSEASSQLDLHVQLHQSTNQPEPQTRAGDSKAQSNVGIGSSTLDKQRAGEGAQTPTQPQGVSSSRPATAATTSTTTPTDAAAAAAAAASAASASAPADERTTGQAAERAIKKGASDRGQWRVLPSPLAGGAVAEFDVDTMQTIVNESRTSTSSRSEETTDSRPYRASLGAIDTSVV